LLSEIKRRQPRLLAIMVTGYPTDESRAEAQEIGASAYLSKPVGLHELFQTFQNVLTHRCSSGRRAYTSTKISFTASPVSCLTVVIRSLNSFSVPSELGPTSMRIE